MSFALVRCDALGHPVEALPPLPPQIAAHCQATAALYTRVGYLPPWVGYVAVADGACVGGGAFVGPPADDGTVEIAYYTLAEFEGRGHASRTAAALVGMARAHTPGIALCAFTLPEENASTRILRGLGFAVVGSAQDPDAGLVWEWRNPSASPTPA